MTDKSAALFRASNIQILDYPLEASLRSALAICDEVVIVVGQSDDDTRDVVYGLRDWLGPHRVRVVETIFVYDLGWQERWWDLASSHTDADWLFYHDADEVIHEDDAAVIRDAMFGPEIKLINFPFIHFYMTPNWTTNFVGRATRLGRRSAGFRMRNWRNKEMPTAPACQMVYGFPEIDAHDPSRPELIQLDTPIYHYSWCRDARALAISQHKHVDWYQNGNRFGLLDGRIPEVEPFDFINQKPVGNDVEPYYGNHPAAICHWLEQHNKQWSLLETQYQAIPA